ncbi:hypothetical protein [Parahalioglobus pacificus]|uniref:DUF4145 domain-containing protein n=1 Tax=Parahalioglobus pacificus TaxID=930806 RepID=A0A918XHP1_9GAMM|nr:hypothetical protein [Halioglobus pacificus]GHD31137.1 hypothetical protein GCM10007053_13880 [Halioglobus pacificus]
MEQPSDFLRAISALELTYRERVVALLWWHGREDQNASRTPKELAEELESAGYAKQTTSRLRQYLKADKTTAKSGTDGFRIKIDKRAALDELYQPYIGFVPVPPSDSVLPREVVAGSRGYIESVTRQINASYDSGLYDCCAVMCRRLLETLVIEVFESKGIEAQIKDANGHYFMFSGLLGALEKTSGISLSRNSKTGLADFKRLGDLSAHNRHYNAKKPDIDLVRPGLRVAAQELLSLSGLIK